MANVVYHPEFRQELPNVYGVKEYEEYRNTLIEMDHILIESGAEHRLISEKMGGQALSSRRMQTRYHRLQKALRYSILLALTGESHRELSIRVADSAIFQWFTCVSRIDRTCVATKSSIERYEKMFDSEEIGSLVHDLNKAVADKTSAAKLLYDETVLKFEKIFADTTCVKANIHFPIDWLFLRDATRTLVAGIIVIRRHGLKHRIDPPKEFLREMNKLCIEMSHTRKKKDGKKARKKILRKMKKLLRRVEKHATTYLELLQQNWDQTDLSELETQVIIERITQVLAQVPQVIKQAHERIIGERRVKNTDKIFSLYDSNIRVIVRGKAGAEVEFGNSLYLAEQEDGLIVDWSFMKDQPPSDSKLVSSSIDRISDTYAKPLSYTADRGFDSSHNRKVLEEQGIYNAICPKSPKLMEERLTEETFCENQKRRSSTEARIGIFQNVYLGNPLRAKGFTNRNIRLSWCIVAHNLWKLAQMAAEKKKSLIFDKKLAA